MSDNILNDITKVYLEQIAANEGYQRNPEKGEKEDKSSEAIPGQASRKMPPRGHKDREAFEKWYAKNVREDVESVDEAVRGQDTEMRKAASAERRAGDTLTKKLPAYKGKEYGKFQKDQISYINKKTKGKHIPGMANEALDPVGREDADIDNDGDTDKSDKYLHKRRKAIGKAIATKKESFSNWRQDLVEVMDKIEKEEDQKQIKEKKNINNKIVINPELKESIEEIGGVLLEVTELEEGYKPIGREKESAMYRRAGNLARTSLSSRGKKKEEAQTKSAKIVSAITKQKEKERFDRIGQSPSHNEEVEYVDESNKENKQKKNDAISKIIQKKLHPSVLPSLTYGRRELKKEEVEEVELDEKTLTPAETKKKEEIVKSMKKSAGDFEKRYPGRGKEVMYATATKQAKKLAEAGMPPVLDPQSQQAQADQANQKRLQTQRKQKLLQILQSKERAVRTGISDINASYEASGEVLGEKQSALDIVRSSVEKKYGKGSVMTGKTEKPKATAAQKAAAQKASSDYIKKTSDHLRHSPRD